MRENKEEQELQWAASNIQKVFRGKKQRDTDKARHEVHVVCARTRTRTKHACGLKTVLTAYAVGYIAWRVISYGHSMVHGRW